MKAIKKKRGKAKKVLSPAEKALKKKQDKLHKSVKSIFGAMGFEYIRTADKHIEFGDLKGEFDDIFLFENIILICEETTSVDKDHLRKKYDFYEEIEKNRGKFLSWVKEIGKEKFEKFNKYVDSRYKVNYLYIVDGAIDISTKKSYKKFYYLGAREVKYFELYSKIVQHSARNEMWKFLGYNFTDIGNPQFHTSTNIESAVLVPETTFGLPENIRLVSFVMSAESLMDCSYVYRKDSWENYVGGYYQRLLNNKKIQAIRKYLASSERTFVDNIIVSLPQDVEFKKDKVPIDIKEYSNATNCSIVIPHKINSIGIIDGQHRIFGHYKGNDALENKIADLRRKMHLLVTGIYYEPNCFSDYEKRKFESELFLQINSKQKPVDAALLDYIEGLQDPFSSVGIATSVVYLLNERMPFQNLFSLSDLDNGKLRTPTLIRYGIADIVALDSRRVNLFTLWDNTKKAALQKHLADKTNAQELLDEYFEYCASALSIYFGAIRSEFSGFWKTDQKQSKLLSITSLVGFVLAFRKALELHGIQEFEFYKKRFSKLNKEFSNATPGISFKKEEFPFVSSHWGDFEKVIEPIWE